MCGKKESEKKGLTTERLVLIEKDPRRTIQIPYATSRPLVLIQVALVWLAGMQFDREHFILIQRHK